MNISDELRDDHKNTGGKMVPKSGYKKVPKVVAKCSKKKFQNE